MRTITKLALLISILLAVAFWWQNKKQQEQLEQSVKESAEEPLVDTAVLLAEVTALTYPNFKKLSEAISSASKQRFSAQIYGLKKEAFDLRVYVTDRNGQVVYDSSGQALGQDYSQWNDVILAMRGAIGTRSSRQDQANRSQPSTLYVAAPIRVAGEVVGVLSVGKPGQNIERFVRSGRDTILFYTVITFLLIALVSILLSHIFLAPISRLTKFARSIAAGQSTTPPALPSGEVRELQTAFISMKSALEGKQYIEHYVQTLTHEMRSPLTAIAASAELLSDSESSPEQKKLINIIVSQAKRLSTFVKDLLAISGLQNQPKFEPIDLDIKELVESVFLENSALLEAKNLSVLQNISANLKLKGDRFLLSRALSNLILNSIEFTPAGGTISINAKIIKNQVCIEVCDTGSGIPEWALPKLFDQFFSLPRPDTKQRSSGMGLALVREIMRLHSGSVEVCNSDKGQGAVFTLRFTE
jgi:two-component system sensor histidine kinase CreC